jgi:hypothetical protein
MVGMQDPENRSAGIRRSRRNLIKMGAIAASATLAIAMKTKPADAVCATAVGCHCFLKGTTIRTTDGDKRIEDLAVGDLLPTVFGGISPIQWIGRYRFKKPDPTKAWVKDVVSVRVARSALGPDVPHADLFVTRAHALLIDDVLVPVCNLINGTTITLYDARVLDELEFFHIKLELHDVIYAEGAPCETLLDVDENAINFSEYLREYGPPISSNAPCAPVLGFGDRVEIKSRFRSAISPWFDRRQKLDIIRDKLDEGEIVLFATIGTHILKYIPSHAR